MTPPTSSPDAADVAKRLEALGVVEDDLAEHFVRASGPGGQKVNKTSSAVHLKHLPTGVEVKAQTTRSQAHNRLLARARLAEALESRAAAARQAARQAAEKRRRQRRQRPPHVKRKMVATKRQRGETKRHRKRVDGANDD